MTGDRALSPLSIPVGRRIYQQFLIPLLGLLLFSSLGLNLVLGWRIRRLREGFISSALPSVANIIGVPVTPIQGSDLEGRPVVVSFANAANSTVLYVFNPKCHWCARNLENIRTLAKARQDRYRFIGISLESSMLKSYVESSAMGFPAYSVSSYGAAPELKLGATPQMIVIGPDGKVVKNWVGALAEGQLKDADKFFDVGLPGPTSE